MTEAPNDAEFWRQRFLAVVRDEKAWQAELNRRRETIEAQTERLVAGERSHAALEAVRQQLVDQIEAMRDVVADREREIGRLFGEVSKAHRQLHEVWSSFSWRTTIPLRSISARLPGLARGLRGIGERYPRLWNASVWTVRSAGRMVLLKSPVAQIPAPPLPKPTSTIIPPADDDVSADLPDAPFRPHSWLCVGDTIEQFDKSPLTETGESSPVAGDHVLFVGATWISPNIERLMSLVERGIGFSLFVDEIVPLEPAAAWMRMVLTHARCVFVSGAAVRDQILRWAVLSDVYVSAAVELGTADSDATVAHLEKFGPVTPLGQPGRLFLPGIVAFAVLPTLEAAQAWCTEDDPQVSILIVNRNAYQLTRACIQQIWANTSGVRYEIVVADGGSSPADCRALSTLGRGIRLLPVGADRFFGEACNIVAEDAQAPLLCLLGNDCFVQPGWLKTLVEALEADLSVGAGGPLLLSPDMTVREAGGMITEQGVPASFGQGDEPMLRPRSVDYVSAAALVVRRDAYLRAGGFDLMYEPVSFEDVDLCFKLMALGLSVQSCPAGRVIRVEADDEPAAESRRKALVDLNRTKFVARWGPFLRSRSNANLAAIRQQIVLDAPAAPARDMALATAVLYTPYPITPGGGERFLLTMASELTRDHRVTIVTPHPYSQLRLQNIAHTFGIDLSRCLMQTEAAFSAAPAPDLMVVLGNYIYPPIAPRTPNAVFICQFPFPMVDHPRRIDQGYRAVIAYSDYARTHILANMSTHQMPPWPVEVVYPPVPQVVADQMLKRPIVLTVGRFFTGGHNKRHDLMIAAFRQVLDAVGGELELHLAGSSTPGLEHMRYLEALMQAAEGMPITFHVNASRDMLEDLYHRAVVYWHATGLGGDLADHPELAEHFGISLVEAMSGECVPMAFDAGGPREIITQGVDGFLYASIDELVMLTADILHPDAAERRQAIGRAAGERAKTFALERFSERVREVLLTSAEG